MRDHEFLARPTLANWKREQSRIRWERRLAEAPGYRLWTLILLLVALTILVVAAWPR